MKIIVTGGSGFVGNSVIKRLVADGHDVRAIYRSPAAKVKVEAAGGTPLEGDLNKIEGFAGYLKWAEVVVHCAAPVVFWESWEFYKKNMIEPTLELAKAASRAGVKRFIQVSSESVLQDRAPLVNIDENHPYPAIPNSNYGRAKKEIELYLRSVPFAMETIIIRPPFVWGPECPLLETIAARAQPQDGVIGKIKQQIVGLQWIDQGQSFFEAVHVKNLAQAISLAITNGNNRQVYFVTDLEPYTVRDFITRNLRKMAAPVPNKSIPASLAWKLAGICEAIWRMLHIVKIAPPVTRFDVAFMAMPRRYRIDKAIHELGYKPESMPI